MPLACIEQSGAEEGATCEDWFPRGFETRLPLSGTNRGLGQGKQLDTVAVEQLVLVHGGLLQALNTKGWAAAAISGEFPQLSTDLAICSA